ncbi:ABC transporter permease [Pseudomonas amygdali pv. myricae]|nr:ABC transporter permease [Pseudomonas amygdali pv. myricae]KPX97433.1 ABC transporter permease [Pseudomonas amygdali pv. myricae]RMT49864.1 ABC transporter permease [Pseudomonas amygdali pv. myricae]RMU99232.1 ABC transporter permease [Pseudomonas amygdali pv. myricae]RMV26549.1 ABC transporter permease [Pseudomonas amygdali pv. myricae]
MSASPGHALALHKGGFMKLRLRPTAAVALAPALAVLLAFWLLPLTHLILLGAQGSDGNGSGYWQVLSSAQYLGSLAQTCLLALVVTLAALLVGGISGVFLARNQFFGRSALVALLTFPLAFPGVVVGFLVILLAGRQGIFAALGLELAGERWIFAYSLTGLFIGYLYFSIPRVILTVMAACESLDRSLEEAAHSLGAGHWRVVCDVIVPGLAPALVSCGAICFATSMGAFGTAFTLGTRLNVTPVAIYNVFTNYANFTVAAALSVILGLVTWAVLLLARRMVGKRSPLFAAQLAFTLLVCAFMLVPVVLSLLAGLTRNYFLGLSSGLTFDWLVQVWQAYSPTVWLSLQLAVACAICVCLVGVPAAYALVRMNNRFSRAFEELMVLPVAMPGLASALALLLTYGQFGSFRSSWLFILVGHVLFTLPFLVRPVMAVMQRQQLPVLEEAAASLGAGPIKRFFSVVVPNCRAGILAGVLMVVTLSLGEFNLTWMLHTPMTKTLPVGLADSYASARLEVASAYTLLFLLLIVPLLIALQAISARLARGESR